MAKAIGNRRRARESAMQILCVMERQTELSVGQAAALYFAHLLGDDGESSTSTDESTLPSDYRLFAETLVSGVRKAQTEIDALLGRSSKNWRLSRMAVPDRNILRLACFELMFCPEVPARAVLNEAIEIARRFGTADSASFVNGVLDRVVAELGRREDGASATESAPA